MAGRWAAILGSVGCALAVASCGGGSAAPKAAPTTTAPANPVADRATAEKINLTASDLPGWQESPNPPDASMNAMGARLSACAGGPNQATIDVVDVTSANFDQAQTEISSDVTMVRSHADGVADVASIHSPKLAGCVNRIAVPAISKELPAGVSLKALHETLFAPPGGIPGSFGIRITGTVSGSQSGASVSLAIQLDEVGFLVKRAEVTLVVDQSGHIGSVAIEPRLVSTLYQRAIAATS